MFKTILGAALLAGALSAQPILVNGRGMTVTAGATTVGTACAGFTACPGSSLNAPGTTSIRFNVYGALNGNYVIYTSGGGPIPCPINMPTLGLNLLVSPVQYFAGVLTIPSTNGCPGRGTIGVLNPPSGTFRFQAVSLTSSGSLGWSTPVRVTI